MNERSDEQPDPLASSAKRLLDQSVQALDRKTVLAVQRARVHAVSRSSARRPWFQWVGGVALASMAVLAVTMWLWQANSANHSPLLLEDLELMQSPENFELSEDLEFYDWLADGTATTG
jgi:negative regulator of sigma E activity